MIEQPEVDLTSAEGDIYKIIDLCSNALIQTGMRLGEEETYLKTVESMKEKITDSKAYIRTLSILAEYCKILK